VLVEAAAPGLVGDDPQPNASAAPAAAPIAPSTSRRPTFLMLMLVLVLLSEHECGQCPHSFVLF
jgi:hypothetical protein